jgi:RNA recognition motif-containing protein
MLASPAGYSQYNGYYDEPMKVNPGVSGFMKGNALLSTSLWHCMGQSNNMDEQYAPNHQQLTPQSCPGFMPGFRGTDSRPRLAAEYAEYRREDDGQPTLAELRAVFSSKPNNPRPPSKDDQQVAMQQVYDAYQAYQAYQQTQALSQNPTSYSNSNQLEPPSPRSLAKAVGTLKAAVGGLQKVLGEMPDSAGGQQLKNGYASAPPTTSDITNQQALRAVMQASSSQVHPGVSTFEAPPGLSPPTFGHLGDWNPSSDCTFTIPGKDVASFEGEKPLQSNAQATAKKDKNISAKKAEKKNSKNKTVQPKEMTTLMIRNVPCRLTQVELLQLLDENGFEDRYDFLHLPVAAPMQRAPTSNLGYGFINFTEPEFAKDFQTTYEGSRLGVSCSAKECVITSAHIQGLAANLRHFRRTTINSSRHKPYIRVTEDNLKMCESLGWKTLKDMIPSQKNSNPDLQSLSTAASSMSKDSELEGVYSIEQLNVELANLPSTSTTYSNMPSQETYTRPSSETAVGFGNFSSCEQYYPQSQRMNGEPNMATSELLNEKNVHAVAYGQVAFLSVDDVFESD